MSSHLETPAPSTAGSGAVAERGPRRGPGRRAVMRVFAQRVFNPVAVRFAGSRAAPIFALARHRGRRSGRMYATPVAARPIATGFVIPLTFGVGADWFQNMLAAGWCVVRWKGVEYALIEPEVMSFDEGKVAYTRLEGAIMARMGIREFARFRYAPRASADAS